MKSIFKSPAFRRASGMLSLVWLLLALSQQSFAAGAIQGDDPLKRVNNFVGSLIFWFRILAVVAAIIVLIARQIGNFDGRNFSDPSKAVQDVMAASGIIAFLYAITEALGKIYGGL